MVAALRAMLDKHTGTGGGGGGVGGSAGPSGGGAAIFVGHSFGTAVVAWVVKQAPELVYAALFLDPICFLLVRPLLLPHTLRSPPPSLPSAPVR